MAKHRFGQVEVLLVHRSGVPPEVEDEPASTDLCSTSSMSCRSTDSPLAADDAPVSLVDARDHLRTVVVHTALASRIGVEELATKCEVPSGLIESFATEPLLGQGWRPRPPTVAVNAGRGSWCDKDRRRGQSVAMVARAFGPMHNAMNPGLFAHRGR